MEFDWSKVTAGKSAATDSMVNIYLHRPGIAVAAFKDGGGLAFVAANLHYNKLIDRLVE